MKLNKARICLDCDELFVPETLQFLDQTKRMDHCPACGSGSHYLLCRWIPTMESVIHIEQQAAKSIEQRIAKSIERRAKSETEIAEASRLGDEKEGDTPEADKLLASARPEDHPHPSLSLYEPLAPSHRPRGRGVGRGGIKGE
jgi:hypothetical protein